MDNISKIIDARRKEVETMHKNRIARFQNVLNIVESEYKKQGKVLQTHQKANINIGVLAA